MNLIRSYYFWKPAILGKFDVFEIKYSYNDELISSEKWNFSDKILELFFWTKELWNLFLRACKYKGIFLLKNFVKINDFFVFLWILEAQLTNWNPKACKLSKLKKCMTFKWTRELFFRNESSKSFEIFYTFTNIKLKTAKTFQN